MISPKEERIILARCVSLNRLQAVSFRLQAFKCLSQLGAGGLKLAFRVLALFNFTGGGVTNRVYFYLLTWLPFACFAADIVFPGSSLLPGSCGLFLR